MIMCFPWVKSLKFRSKNWVLPMFTKPQNLKGLTVNLPKAFLNNVPTFRLFLLFCNIKYYGINFKITNLDSF